MGITYRLGARGFNTIVWKLVFAMNPHYGNLAAVPQEQPTSFPYLGIALAFRD